MTEPLTEDEITEWTSGARPDWYSARLLAMFRAEQEARVKAEAQRDRAAHALRGMVSVADDSQGVVGLHLNGDVALWGELEEVAVAEAALREIEGVRMSEPLTGGRRRCGNCARYDHAQDGRCTLSPEIGYVRSADLGCPDWLRATSSPPPTEGGDR